MSKARDVTFFEFYNERRNYTILERIMKPFVDFIIGTFALMIKGIFKIAKAYFYGTQAFDYRYLYMAFGIYLLYIVILSIIQ
tara:strand:+ start:422 stop:667 length:246 start_codon:yes stop_codon:yes gene_type:complete